MHVAAFVLHHAGFTERGAQATLGPARRKKSVAAGTVRHVPGIERGFMVTQGGIGMRVFGEGA